MLVRRECVDKSSGCKELKLVAERVVVVVCVAGAAPTSTAGCTAADPTRRFARRRLARGRMAAAGVAELAGGESTGLLRSPTALEASQEVTHITHLLDMTHLDCQYQFETESVSTHERTLLSSNDV